MLNFVPGQLIKLPYLQSSYETLLNIINVGTKRTSETCNVLLLLKQMKEAQ